MCLDHNLPLNDDEENPYVSGQSIVTEYGSRFNGGMNEVVGQFDILNHLFSRIKDDD
jgi:hypothetical protein